MVMVPERAGRLCTSISRTASSIYLRATIGRGRLLTNALIMASGLLTTRLIGRICALVIDLESII